MKIKWKTILKIGIVLLTLFYLVYLGDHDTLYAAMLSTVLSDYDIQMVDDFLDEDTLITYGDRVDTYKNLRHNVIAAFEAKDFMFHPDSSYGHDRTPFFYPITRTVGVNIFVHDTEYTGAYGEMKLVLNGLTTYRVKSLTFLPDEDFWGYLFFGIE